MNFLLHRHLALRELESPVAGIGAMLPDLWRMAHRRVRARAGLTVERGEPLGELQRGVEHHLDADRWFHSTDVFVQGERDTAAAFRTAAADAPKLGMFAHMGWEMCLDGALLLRGVWDEELDRLRDDFDKATPHAMAALADAHGAARLDEDERAEFAHRLLRICEGLCNGPWLGGYTSGEGLVEGLSRLRARFGFADLDPREREQLALVLDARLRHASAVLDGLLAQRHG